MISKIKCFKIQYNIKFDQHSKNKATYNSEKIKKTKNQHEKTFKKHNPPKMDNFKKQENTTIRSWYLNWTHERSIVAYKHQRKCKNSCEKFQALKSIGSQHN